MQFIARVIFRGTQNTRFDRQRLNGAKRRPWENLMSRVYKLSHYTDYSRMQLPPLSEIT